MKQRINDFVDLFHEFHNMSQVEQILKVIYFHTVQERRDSINQEEIVNLFRFAGLAVPKNLGQMLGYLCGRAGKILPPKKGEYELHREIKREIGEEIRVLRAQPVQLSVDENGPFEFKDRIFTDKKVAALLGELRRCHATECWNACGMLMRIVIERAVDTVDPEVRAKTGLKDKLNKCKEVKSLGKSVHESIGHLHSAKIMGDIAAHDSRILVDEPDIALALPHFRLLLKSVTTV